MRSIIRKIYLLPRYNRDLQLILQKMTQGNRSVENYFKDMEVTMIRAQIKEDNEETMA